MSRIVFNEDRHEYTMDGRIIPSVTQVLKDLSADEYRHVDKEVMGRAAQLGTAVHRMIELDLKGTLNTASLHELVAPYYQAWLNFLNVAGFEMLASEQRVYSTRYGYAGTLDLFGRMNGELVLIDAKRCASVPRTAGPQTAAYLQAFLETAPEYGETQAGKNIQRYALHLTPTADKTGAKWRLVPFKGRDDFKVFLSCQTLLNWKKAA